MNKKFYFALALTAGLFASCSSDDLTAEAPQQGIEVNDNDAAQIQINVGNPAKYTRGTGSVTGTEWGGQDFNLFMFNKGTFTPATYVSGGEVTNIYFNTVMTTTPGTTIANEVLAGDVINYQYFPATGRFDFWAYRADDAADVDGTTGEPIVKYTDADGNDAAVDEAVQVRIPFTLDGSQDLMIAETKTADAATELAATGSVNIDDAPSYIYSAYAARRGVNPKMTFKHQLTRLQFQVKAATRDVSDAATPKLAVGTTNANGDEYFAGFKVTKVEVWSKNQGELIAAYKGDAPAQRIVWNEGQEWTARDENDAWLETTTLVPFELKSRTSSTTNADIILYAINMDVTNSDDMEIAEGYELKSNTFDDNTECYITDGFKTNGEPSGTKYTRGTVPAGTTVIYIPAAKDGKWTAVVNEDVTENLNDLEEVIPHWEGYDASEGWRTLIKAATRYVWIDRDDLTDDEKAAAVKIDAAPVEDPANAINTARTDAEIGTFFYYLELGSRKYVELDAIENNTDGAAEFAGTEDELKASAGVVGNIKYIDGDPVKYYIFADAGDDPIAGDPVATPIGESMMVAPADENGYLVRFTYERCVVLKNDGSFEKREGEAIINVKVKATANAGTEYEGKFAPAKVYVVTAILYSDGEIKYENGTIEEEGVGTGDLDDNGAGYGLEN